MTNLTVDFGKITGKIKPMHAVGQPPYTGGFNKLDCSPMQILADANIPYSRLHDVGGPFGGNRFVDIPNLFRDFDADETKEENYDFTFTDVLIKGMIEYGVQPYFRLGVTIENQANIKAYRIYPPKDFAKWARICEHVIRHYNYGWADGYHYGIKYWEIWNEPENRKEPELNQLWKGTAEQYYELYDVTSKHLKKCFGDEIKVGGYGACGFYGIFGYPEKYGMDIPRREEERYTKDREIYRVDFFINFIKYIKEHGSPIDFFSWHCYTTIEFSSVMADFVDKVLTENGYGDLETHLNEWNHSHNRILNKQIPYASGRATAMLCGMQDKKTSMLMYYDARFVSISAYGGFYDLATFKPGGVYYAFKAFGELYALGNRADISGADEGIYLQAATDGNKKAVLITNISDETKEITTNLGDDMKAYVIDVGMNLEEDGTKADKFVLTPNRVVLFKNY
ncbi:MAG: hypothetical protein IKW02_04515 [Clostridia bacterium]|nr:hypothetical protein [Clostridia bacterium]